MPARFRGPRLGSEVLLVGLVLFITFVLLLAFDRRPQIRVTRPPAASAGQPPVASETNDDDTSDIPDGQTDSQPPEQQDAQQAEIADGSCHINGLLPDPVCTPGSIDPEVTQENINQTICASGYSKKVRPPQNVTGPMKITSMRQYGLSGSTKDYEYDHLVSLQLGGAPIDQANLWPEPGASPNPKDAVENRLHQLVCNGTITLLEAQQRIASNWVTALDNYYLQ